MKYTPDTALHNDIEAYNLERDRIYAWQATFNAAVTGLCTRFSTKSEVVEKATVIANEAHGVL